MLSYPVSNGVIDTVHGFALQSAIVDQRYFGTWQRISRAEKYACEDGQKMLQQIADGVGRRADQYRWLLAQQISRCLKISTARDSKSNGS